MRLRRIEIEDFRRLAGRWELDGLGDGLTVIGGDNEEGKSTLLAAVKAALLEHHRVGGQVRETMTAHGGGTPRVALTFESSQTIFRLEKEFGRRCELRWSDGRFTGDEAEERLAELLRFERRQGRAERRAEHQGLLALFWVEQGTSFDSGVTDAALAAQHGRIAGSIEAEIGVVTAGPALSRLRERVQEQMARFLTPKGQVRKGGELDQVSGRLDQLAREAEQLRAARRRYDQLVDRLEAAREERRRFEAGDRLGRARARLERARSELERIGELEAERTLVEQEIRTAAAELARLEAELRQRAEQGRELERLAAELVQIAAEVERVASERAAAEAEVVRAEAAELAAVERAADRRRRFLLAESARQLVEQMATAQRLERARVEADQLHGELVRLEAELARSPLREATVQALRQKAAALDRQEASLAAVATTLELVPEAGRRVRRPDGRAVEVGRLELVEPAELLLEGFGRIRVLPGGADLEARRQAAAQARADLERALLEAGVGDLAAAETALASRHGLEQERARHRTALETVLRAAQVPDRDTLAGRVAVLERQIESRRQGLGEGLDPQALAAELEPLRDRLREDDAAVEAARSASAGRGAALAALRERSAGTEERRRARERRREELSGTLARAEAERPRAALETAVAEAGASLAARRSRLAELDARLASLDAEGVRARLEAAGREIAALDAERQRLRTEVDRLEGEARGLGAEACSSRLDELEPELAELARRQTAVEREAAAWRLLATELEAAERAVRDRLVEPVRARLAPLLKRLWPDAEPVLDPASLAPRGLRRDGIEEGLDTLSVGTREQLAILVRLALAELLLEREGEAPCLILDDALVFADEARLERMQAILAGSAERLQVLLLTCRPRDYLGLPGRRIRLEDCRRPG
jgi:DNA repair exonuclease SbcCD ATPase subunit